MYKIINNQLIRIVVIYEDIVFELVEMDLNAIAATIYLLNNDKYLTLFHFIVYY